MAIIGASDNSEKVGGILLKKSLESKCKIIAVNPNHDSLFGIRCYKTILDYSEKIDLVVIAVPKDFVLGVMVDCAKKKIKNVIIVSAGFSEVGNTNLEKEVLEVAKRNDINVLGPNCFGIFNSSNNLDLTFSMTRPSAGNIALVSQSGALWSFVADAFSGIGFSKFVGLGNMADLDFDDFIEYLTGDEKTKNIILYIEKLKRGAKFIEICKKAIKKGKKIYAIKSGSSLEGSKAAFSHTGSLATDYNIYSGAFKQAGVDLCKTLEEAIEKSTGKKFVGVSRKLSLKKDIKIITNAGGAGVLVSDYLSEKGYNVLESRDIIGTALAEDYRKALLDLKNFSGSIFVVLTSQSMTEIEKTARVCVDMIKELNNPIIPVFLGKKAMGDVIKIFDLEGMTYFNNFKELIASL
jgi:acetyltransferase